jgi:hypothetical protein
MSVQVQRMRDETRKQQVRAQLLINDMLMLASPALKHKLEAAQAESACARRRVLRRCGARAAACVLTQHCVLLARPRAWRSENGAQGGEGEARKARQRVSGAARDASAGEAGGAARVRRRCRSIATATRPRPR